MIQLKSFLPLALAFAVINTNAQTKPANSKPGVTNAALKDGSKVPSLNFEYALNDPFKARIYTLKNGMKVYMSVYKNAPRIQTYIAVKAGSKNDPATATGLAHYLEHMVFKGTDKFGTKDFTKESVEITKIENLYETYRQTKDEGQRKKIYHQIDSISGVAAKYAIANEYDKMMAGIGGQGTNAFTSFDQTVYVNDIPSNQLENWLKVEAERYRKPVLRLFHTELEAVYEEKNRGLDSDNSKLWEAVFAGLFTNHNYGKQTTIGTIDHLKNPSMKEIMKYFNANYVPNNMAICLSGDFDPDETIKLIEKNFGSMPSKPVAPYTFEKEAPITQKIVKEIIGPDAANLAMAWRFAGTGTKDADMINLINLLLVNGRAGLLDLNLNQQQKVLNSGGYAYVLKDYSTHILFAEPKEGQSLEEAEKLLLDQLELLKKGEFPDWLMNAVITDLKLQKTKELENNQSRAMAFVDAFVNDTKWQQAVNMVERMSKITKQEVIDFAKANYSANNYVVVYKRVGEDKNIQKVEKPQITPVEVNRDDQSPFVKNILNSKTAAMEPKFIDYEKDVMKTTMNGNIPVLYSQNTENQLFDLYYAFDMGSNNDKLLPVAIDYIPYLGTSKMSPAEVQQEFYKLGCAFNVFNSDNQTWISLTGLNENFEKATRLFEELLVDPKIDEAILKNLVSDILKKRSDAKQQKGTILQKMMVNYAKYGALNPATNVLSEEALNKLQPSELAALIKSLTSYQHRILYYGPKLIGDVKESLNALHNVPATGLKPCPAETNFVTQAFNNTVYVVDYDMKQAEIVILTEGDKYDAKNAPLINMYNEYFGGGMSSVVFQDLRESKALAYSCYSTYRSPKDPKLPFYNFSYIGSQADKLPEAMAGMMSLLNNVPKSDISFGAAKEAILQNIRTERINKADILFDYLNAEKFGLKTDIRKDIYARVATMTYDDVKKFQDEKIKNKPASVLVLGKKDLLDIKTLEKYGTVKYLTLKDVFGY
ncbi:MAG: peptidase domain protein [Bacteroidetes bacterium]|jgi:predicted Zn-dependent peptidase|nr:peptidase domain protein [Bacteroidota bacterium]